MTTRLDLAPRNLSFDCYGPSGVARLQRSKQVAERLGVPAGFEPRGSEYIRRRRFEAVRRFPRSGPGSDRGAGEARNQER